MAGNLTAMIAAAFSGSAAPPVTSDPYYEYTTLLLPGNGTNGAQNNTFLDSSTNNFTITRNGHTTQGTFSPFSQTGWGNYFSGSSTNLSVASTTALQFGTGEFTVESWVYLTATPGAQYAQIIGRTLYGTNADWMLQITNATKLTFYMQGSFVATSTASISLNTWTHVAVSRNSSGQIRLFINGSIDGTATNSGSTENTSSGAYTIGSAQSASTVVLTGYLSNLRAVKGVCVYTGAFTPPTSPLTSTQSAGTNISAITGTQTSLLTCQSNRFVDNSVANSGTGFPITPNGSPSVQAFSPFNPSASWSAATYGGSGYFDGTGDYLTTPSTTAVAFPGDWTIEMWYYPISLVANAGILAFNDDKDNLDASSSGNGIAYYNGSTQTTFTGISLTALTWQHIAIVNSGGTVRAYINGVQSTNSASGVSTSSARVMYILSNRLGSNLLNAYVSSLRIVKGTAVYTGAFTPPSLAPLTTAGSTSAAAYPSTTNVNTSFASSATSLLLNYTNAGIYDAASKNDLETVDGAKISTAVNNPFGASTGVMAFDGTGDWLVAYGSLADLSNFGAGNFTIETWVRFSDLSGLRCFCGKWGGASNRGWIFSYEANALYFSYSTTGTNATDVTGSWTPSINTWYYLAVIRNGADLKLYVDGSQKGTTHNISTSSIYASTSVLSVAQRGDNVGLLNGYLQDLRITKGYARDVTVVPTAAFPTL
jgi:hypothetical protein